MNELNYATKEASQRLADAGIVLETENFWAWDDDKRYSSYIPRFMKQAGADAHDHQVPAPSMSEVWRELPAFFDFGQLRAWLRIWKDHKGLSIAQYDTLMTIKQETKPNTNPTDALIDLVS